LGNFWISLISGIAAGIANIFILSITLKRAVTYPPKQAGFFVLRRFILRYLFVFIMLYLSISDSLTSFAAAVSGILLIKFITIVLHARKML